VPDLKEEKGGEKREGAGEKEEKKREDALETKPACI
jgi:hypothetical protein